MGHPFLAGAAYVWIDKRLTHLFRFQLTLPRAVARFLFLHRTFFFLRHLVAAALSALMNSLEDERCPLWNSCPHCTPATFPPCFVFGEVFGHKGYAPAHRTFFTVPSRVFRF